MATGITQEQVNGAIDQLVAAGQRPTIERIRGVLGTGSPNTVNRMLDTWWASLGARLTTQLQRVAMPAAPESVSVAATQLWEIALDQARTQAHGEVAHSAQALSEAQAALSAERAELQATAARHARVVEVAEHARSMAEARAVDLQQLVDQLADQVLEIRGRHDTEVALNETLTGKLERAQTLTAALQERAASERTALETAHRAAEDRWLREVDRARQEASTAATEVTQVQRASAAAAQQAQQHAADLTARLRQAERDDAAKTARLAALEGQLDRLHEQLKQRLELPTAKRAPAAKKIGKVRSKLS